jgi:predicted kinase
MNWEDFLQFDLEAILTWAENEPWAREMAACAQDENWHAEGDVWTHTKMVCRELPKLDEWSELSSLEQTTLILTALFHDSGKPATTAVDPLSGRLRSPKHSQRSQRIVRNVLRELGCDFATREAVAHLVRFHGRPVYLLDKPDPGHEVVHLSWLVSNKLLGLFAIADNRGRTCIGPNRAEADLELWKVAAIDNDCYDQPFQFVSDHARFLFYRRKLTNLHYQPHDQFSCTVTLMSGLPGSGKDTWVKNHRPDLPVVSLDSIRRELNIEPTENQGAVAQLAKQRCRELLRSGTSFAFNATNLIRQTRSGWIDLFHDYKAKIEIVYLEPSLEAILRQNKNRNATVPQRVIERFAQRLEPPTLTECHSLVLSTS